MAHLYSSSLDYYQSSSSSSYQGAPPENSNPQQQQSRLQRHHQQHHQQQQHLPPDGHYATTVRDTSTGALQHQLLQHQQQQQHNPLPTIRSNPIAIMRSPSRADTSDDDDDDDHVTEETEGEAGVVDVELDALNLAAEAVREDSTTSRSLPSRLLRAPLLGSIPTNEDVYLNQHHMLPPPMTLTEPLSSSSTVKPAPWDKHRRKPSFSSGVPSYGSLRESHDRGRFLDGPSSYRDRQTGYVHSFQQNRVRFHDPSTSNNSFATSASARQQAMSIGERIMKSRQKQVQSAENSADKKPTSSLAAMLEASNDNPSTNHLDTAMPPADAAPSGAHINDIDRQPSVSFYGDQFQPQDRLPSDCRSTSLTGLEILQSNFRLEQKRNDFDLEPPTEIPRDVHGHNALLSRSFSDPSPRLRAMNDPPQGIELGAAAATSAASLAASGMLSPPVSNGSSGVSFSLRALQQQQQQQMQSQPASQYLTQQQGQTMPYSTPGLNHGHHVGYAPVAGVNGMGVFQQQQLQPPPGGLYLPSQIAPPPHLGAPPPTSTEQLFQQNMDLEHSPEAEAAFDLDLE